MENHVRLLGVLTIAAGTLSGLLALFQFLFFGGAIWLAVHFGINAVIVSGWLWTMLALTIPSIVVGIALIGFSSWARSAGIILAILELLSVPLGTAVGLYGLWVLFSDEADMIFARRYGQYVIGRR